MIRILRLVVFAFACGTAFGAVPVQVHVAPTGKPSGAGTAADPVSTLEAGRKLARASAGKVPVEVVLHAGVYYLAEPLRLEPEDSGTAAAPVVYRSAGDGEVVVSGGRKLDLVWRAAEGGRFEASVEAGLEIDQVFLNGERQHMARYPNFDPSVRHFNGYAADAFDPVRARRWADPRGAYMHAMHRHEWGDYHYLVTGRDAEGRLVHEGGWQNNRQMGMHERYRMIENVREELDAPGEWFHDRSGRTLHLIPPAGVDLATAVVEVVRLRHLVEWRGTRARPVRFVSMKGLTFRHASRTFMENREPLLRSDWTTYRGGALSFEGAEDCSVEEARFDQVGGNAVFVSGYNRRVWIRGSELARTGANGVAFVGLPAAVRSPLFEYGQRQDLSAIDREPGPKTDDYPADCGVEDCLIYLSGRYEKQTAPVQIAMAQGITVRHCSIYDVPRAGINIGDGCWGGHLIEHCDIFDTVLETGDHGSFNSWGRDRFWGLTGVDLNTVTTGNLRELPRLDMVRPTILRNNRWRCDHGWDIDLDDGSSHYEIRNNLCLNGGIKLREGFYRVCENNIMVNNSFHPHVWYGNSEDVFRRNIVFTPYRPIEVKAPWGRECDANLLHRPGQTEAVPATGLAGQSGRDANSLIADARFVDPARGDYRVREDSPALKLGFVNFPMNEFGVRSPRLRAMAKTPQLPGAPVTEKAGALNPTWVWRGAKVKDLEGQEFSVVGVAAEAGGVLVTEVPAATAAEQDGLQRHDLIRSLDGTPLKRVADLVRLLQSGPETSPVVLSIRRNQFEMEIRLPRRGTGPKPAGATAP